MTAELVELAWRQTWQVTLLAAAIASLVALCGRDRPHLAHALFLAVLLKCLVPPLWPSPLGLFCWLQPAATATAVAPAIQPSVDNTSARDQTTKVELDDASERLGDAIAFAAESAATQLDNLPASATRLPPRSGLTAYWTFLAQIAAGAWLFGCLVRLTSTLSRSIGV